MKIIRFIIPALLIMMISCIKEEPVITDQSKPTVTQYKAEPAARRRFFDNNNIPGVDGVDYGCEPVQEACIDDVDVTPNDQGAIEDLFDIIRNGTQDEIEEAFAENKAMLLSYMYESHINLIISGDLLVSARGDSFTSGSTYMILKEGSTRTAVYPFHF
jgi:hypothetical protein